MALATSKNMTSAIIPAPVWDASAIVSSRTRFGGAFCDGNDYVKTTDTLSSFNKALESLDCVQIYDSSSGYYYEDDDNGEDNPDDNQDAVDFTALDNTVEILKYSITCDVNEFPGACPDPHGLKHKYSARLRSALSKVDMSNKSLGEIAMNALTGVLFFVSLLLGATIIRKRRRLAKKGRKKNLKSTPPPPSADNASVVSSSTASSAASSDHSVPNKSDEVDEETPYQAQNDVTRRPPFVVSSAVVASKVPKKKISAIISRFRKKNPETSALEKTGTY